MKTASRKPTTNMKKTDKDAKIARLVTEIFQRRAANKRSYCAKPAKSRAKSEVGSVREFVREKTTVQMVQPMKTNSTVAIIGLSATLACRFRKSLFGGLLTSVNSRPARPIGFAVSVMPLPTHVPSLASGGAADMTVSRAVLLLVQTT